MNQLFYKLVQNSTAHQKSREQNADFVLKNPHFFDTLFEIGSNTFDKNHHKAMWIMEIVVEQNMKLLNPRLADFCEMLPKWKNESALRSVSKICLFLVKDNAARLNAIQRKQITEICFDWIVDDRKVATKVYAIYTLLELGKNDVWIFETLHPILEKDFHLHSAAYKIAAKKALRLIVKNN